MEIRTDTERSHNVCSIVGIPRADPSIRKRERREESPVWAHLSHLFPDGMHKVRARGGWCGRLIPRMNIAQLALSRFRSAAGDISVF